MKKYNIPLIVISLLVLSIGWYFYTWFYGTPWGKIKAKNGAEIYLKHKYTQKMIINDKESWYSFEKGLYIFIAYTEENSNLSFRVQQIKQEPYFVDTYFISNWRREIEDKFKPLVQKLYSNKDDGYAAISLDTIANKNEWGIADGWGISEVTTYNEVKDKVKDLDIFTMIKRPFNDNNPDEEYEKMFKIVEFIKEQDYKPTSVSFNYNTARGSSSNGFKDWQSFNFYGENLININTKEDLKKFKR